MQQVDLTDIHGASLLIRSEARMKEVRLKLRKRMKRKCGYCMMYLLWILHDVSGLQS